ncbi:MAG: RICIN domain-containing protein [Lachnospiraceae bacterium]|nr:RICIN domain-containing protein [Lachnospiraceae bacterium]
MKNWETKLVVCIFVVVATIASSFGSFGVMAREYPSSANEGSEGTVSAALRVRNGPGLNYKQIGLLKKNSVVRIEGEIVDADGYYWSMAPEYSGWIAIDYLTGITYVPSGSYYIGSYVTIPDGDYNILTNYGLFLAATSDSTDLRIHIDAREEDKTFRFIRQPDNSYVIASKATGLCMDLGGDVGNGTNVLMNTPDGTRSQRWFIGQNTLGKYILVNALRADCTIDIQDRKDSTENANVQIWAFHGDSNQTFEIRSIFENGPYTFDYMARQALDIIVDRLEGRFFTYSGEECSVCKGKFVKGHGCWNCSSTHILESSCTWYHNMFPEFSNTSARHFPRIAYKISKGSNGYTGQSCFGFAAWAQYWVYSYVLGEQNFTGRPYYAKGKLTYDFFVENNVRAGDVVRRGDTHSFIVYSYNKDGCTIIDSNGGADGKLNCMVDMRTIKFNGADCAISRPKTSVSDTADALVQ